MHNVMACLSPREREHHVAAIIINQGWVFSMAKTIFLLGQWKKR